MSDHLRSDAFRGHRPTTPPVNVYNADNILTNRYLPTGDVDDSGLAPADTRLFKQDYSPDRRGRIERTTPFAYDPNGNRTSDERGGHLFNLIDCGPAPGRRNFPNPTNPNYQMERDEIARRGYGRYVPPGGRR